MVSTQTYAILVPSIMIPALIVSGLQDQLASVPRALFVAFISSSIGHAMALIGYRTQEDGQHRFLVQNWWRRFQYFEVDLQFLAARCAMLVWIATPVMELPPYYPRTSTEGGENDFDGEDRPDDVEE